MVRKLPSSDTCQNVGVETKPVWNISTNHGNTPIKPLPGKKNDFKYIRATVDSRMSAKILDRIRKPVSIYRPTPTTYGPQLGRSMTIFQSPRMSDSNILSGSKKHLEDLKSKKFNEEPVSKFQSVSSQVQDKSVFKKPEIRKEPLADALDLDFRIQNSVPFAGLPSLRRTYSVAECIHWNDESTGF